MKKILYLIILVTAVNFGQEAPLESDISINKFVDGSLMIPAGNQTYPLVIIIPDAGPTDRNGNQNFLKNNSLKKLANKLSENNIATFRYDKRIVKEMRRGNVNLKVSFDDFISDASSVIDYFKNSDQFKSIYLMGHGQGSLVAMLAMNGDVKGLISIAGAGKSLDSTLISEVEKTAPALVEDTKRVLQILKEGKTTTDYPQALESFFDVEIQPFMSSWIKYDPRDVIINIDAPILVINGTKNLQVPVEESYTLSGLGVNSQLMVTENMNHVMFLIDGDDLENSKSYNESHRKISVEMVENIVKFINETSN